MKDSARLEHGYQRLLTWYPRAFRDDHEQEVLTVLMAGARPGQRRPGLAATADLIRSAVGMRLLPGARRPPRTVSAAVWLMIVGAAVNLVAWLTVTATAGQVTATVTRRDPAQANAVVGHVTSVEVLAPLLVAVWLWLAWANGRGHGWARAVFTGFAGATTASLVLWLALGAIDYALVDLIAAVGLWLVQLSVLVLMYNSDSSTYYRREAAAR